jgi:predicted nucleotidyltransferase
MNLDKKLKRIVTGIKNILGDDLEFIVLFGSAATGNTHPQSDIDIGFKVSSSEDLYLTIFGEVLSLFDSSKEPHIDVTLLNMASLSLQFGVVRDGKILYSRDVDVWQTYVEYVLTRYPDWNLYIDNYLKQSIGV